jgi:hypothetical protein
MRRYNQLPITTRYDGKRVYKSIIYPPVASSTSDIHIVSNESDFLDTLAYKYYSDPSLWWVIANANNLGKGRLSVSPGLTLRIPIDISGYINEFNRINS